jgi:mannose-6-phosphate isomerase-like protein (cupin superfamily)
VTMTSARARRRVCLLAGAWGLLSVVAGAAQRVPPLSESKTLANLPAAAQAVPIPAGRQVFFHRGDLPMVTLGEGIRRGVALGDTISVSVDELDPRLFRGTPPESAHHHTHEQANFGWEGTLEELVGGDRVPVAPMTIAMVPPDVLHTVTRVMGPGTVTSLEFSAIRREDLLPGHAPVVFPARESPRPLPAGFRIATDFDAIEWVGEPGTSRFAAALGETMTVFVYHIPATEMDGVEAPGHHHTNEQISVVLRGHPEIRLGDQFQKVSPGTIMVVPPDVDHYGISPVDGEDLVLVEFQPIVREDLRRAMEARR